MQLDLSTSPRLDDKKIGISLEADFKFTDAIVLQRYELIALFVSGWSGDLEFVGKLYDYTGNEIAVIPFPPEGRGGRQNAYWYSTEAQEGVWVGFHQQSERDFGGIFNLENMRYESFHEAR